MGTGKKRKKFLSRERKQPDPLLVHAEPFIGYSNYYFQNCLPPFWPGPMAWQHPKKEKIPSPPPPKRIKPDPR